MGSEKIVRLVSDVTGERQEKILKRGRKGEVCGLLMEMLYRGGGLNHYGCIPRGLPHVPSFRRTPESVRLGAGAIWEVKVLLREMPVPGSRR
jgi:hypothetical protein